MTSITPLKLAIYYGYPSLVNGSNGNINQAAAVFSAYDVVVFGDTLESTSHPDHSNVIQIIANPAMVNTEVFGYIDSTTDTSIIQDNIDAWNAMGVSGIFLDKFGYDFNVTREKQRSIVWSVHNAGNNKLKAFVNSFNPDDAFSPNVDSVNNPNGLPTRLTNKDIYLAESFAVVNGNYDDNDLDNNGIKDWEDKATKLVAYRQTYGTKIAAIGTQGAATFDQNQADYSYFAAVINKFNYWGWGEQFYSASSAQLPFISRKPFYGAKFDSDIVINNGVYERRTNIGIHIDTNLHTTDTSLNI